MAKLNWTKSKNKPQPTSLESTTLQILKHMYTNGQSEKPLATVTLKFDIGDNTFAEHVVVMKFLTDPITGLHFVRQDYSHQYYT